MSSRPLFQVGEKVWLVSKTWPELNGSSKVVSVIEASRPGCGRCSYGYFLTIINSNGRAWCECALRKRYPPADSFASIMDSCKDKVTA